MQVAYIWPTWVHLTERYMYDVAKYDSYAIKNLACITAKNFIQCLLLLSKIIHKFQLWIFCSTIFVALEQRNSNDRYSDRGTERKWCYFRVKAASRSVWQRCSCSFQAQFSIFPMHGIYCKERTVCHKRRWSQTESSASSFSVQLTLLAYYLAPYRVFITSLRREPVAVYLLFCWRRVTIWRQQLQWQHRGSLDVSPWVCGGAIDV